MGKFWDILQLLTTSYEQWLLYSEELKWVLQVDNKDLIIGALRSHMEVLRSKVDKTLLASQGCASLSRLRK